MIDAWMVVDTLQSITLVLILIGALLERRNRREDIEDLKREIAELKGKVR